MLNLTQVRVIDPILTTIVLGYKNPGLVGATLFPEVPVDISGGQVLQFGKEDFMAYSTRRAPGGPTKRIEFGYQGVPYALENHSLEGKVPYEFQRDAGQVPGIDLGRGAVLKTMRSIMLGIEVSQAAVALNASNYDSSHKVTLTSTAKWSDASSDPYAQWLGYRESVRATCGMYPNVGVISALAFKALISNPSMKARYQYTSSDAITAQMIAKLFELEKLSVGAAVQASDAGTFSDVWGNNMVAAYVPQPQGSGGDPMDKGEPSYGYTYTMRGHPLAEEPYYERNAKSWIFPVVSERVPVLTGILSGFLIQTPN